MKSFKIFLVLSLAVTAFCAIPVQAQTGKFIPSGPQEKPENPYAGLPEEKDFDMGKLETEFNKWFEEAKNICATDGIKETPYADISFYSRRMAFYAGHPYFEKATGIKADWVKKLSQALRYLAVQKVEYERAMDFRKNEAPPYLKKLLEGREKTYEFMKKPEKVEKEDKDDKKSKGKATTVSAPRTTPSPQTARQPKPNPNPSKPAIPVRPAR